MTPTTQKGYLVLADITGFTPFLASTELEHSQEILQHMLKGIIGLLTPTFALAEVEGDAVFVYSKDSRISTNEGEVTKFSRKERVLDVIEYAYYSFRDMKTTYRRIRSCNCKACQMAGSLDLKFIVHYGDYIMNNVGGKDKPLGPSVNIAHRLLKNHVAESTGWTAYALFTKDCFDAIDVNTEKFHKQTETYEHIGPIETYSINLDKLYHDFTRERKVFLSLTDADFVIEKDFPIPPAELWEWENDPKKRNIWLLRSDWRIGLRPKGRTGKGSTNHCVNSKVVEKIMDYRPFQYYTSSMGRGIFNFTQTVNFEQIESGTRLSWHVKMNSILPKWARKIICQLILLKGVQVQNGFEKLFKILSHEAKTSEEENPVTVKGTSESDYADLKLSTSRRAEENK